MASSAMTYEEAKSHLPETALMSVEGLPYPKVASGKVREIFDVGEYLLMVTTDRVSAYDVVMPNGIPGKGIVLTQISLFWFDQTESIIANHLAPNHGEALRALLKDNPELIARSMLVKKLQPLPVEAVVRGYLSGSGWQDYNATGKLFGQEVPGGLVESGELPQPYFTPTTKASEGHDEPISLERCEELLGADTFAKVRDTAVKLYEMGRKQAAEANIIVADTKFEFGQDEDGTLYLIDEVLTPDSSRFWPAEVYAPGKGQPSYDKQFVRDYLSKSGWDKTPPAPELPDDVVSGTQMRYRQALSMLVG